MYMDDRIVAEFAAMEQAADGFQRELNALHNELSGLDRNLRASLARWEGDAAHAYWQAHNKWQLAANDMAKQLAWLQGLIVAAHRNYQNSLHTNVTMWDVE